MRSTALRATMATTLCVLLLCGGGCSAVPAVLAQDIPTGRSRPKQIELVLEMTKSCHGKDRDRFLKIIRDLLLKDLQPGDGLISRRVGPPGEDALLRRRLADKVQ